MQRPRCLQWPPALEHALLAALAGTSKKAHDIPDRAPLVPLRNALLWPGAAVPLALTRAGSRVAVGQALSSSRLVALFAQIDPAKETAEQCDLHGVGTLASVSGVSEADGVLWVSARALAWVRLMSIDSESVCAFARIQPFVVRAEGGEEQAQLEAALRESVGAFAATLPDPEPALARLERMSALELADAFVAELPCELADKARYVSESSLLERLKWVLARAELA